MTSDVQAIGANPAVPASSAQTTAAAGHGFRFHDFLSAINPLQYVPGVGTIYRALTGDVIPEWLRQAGSLLFSGLLGGPIGLGINIATIVAEKATGIDPEKIAAAALNPPPPAAVAATVAPAAPAEAPVVPAAAVALTPAQLAAYGVTTTAAGNLKLGSLEGADVLNAVQLAGLTRTAVAAYAANQPTS